MALEPIAPPVAQAALVALACLVFLGILAFQVALLVLVRKLCPGIRDTGRVHNRQRALQSFLSGILPAPCTQVVG